MLYHTVFLCLVSVCFALEESTVQMYRQMISLQNAQQIFAHNSRAPSIGFTLEAYPKFVSLTLDELRASLLSELPPEIKKMTVQAPVRSSLVVLPRVQATPNVLIYANKDWQVEGRVTSVKDQGFCGSCWAFAACADIESSYLFRGKTYDLSEQELCECSTLYGNEGCNGGWMGFAFNYIMRRGIMFEANYPYRTSTAQKKELRECEARGKGPVHISSYKHLSKYMNDCDQLAKYIIARPVVTAVSASAFEFIFYKGGILNKCGLELNHAVQVTALYYDRNGLNYWKIKNSWGVNWGESGYMRIDRNPNGGNLCGICSVPLYSII